MKCAVYPNIQSVCNSGVVTWKYNLSHELKLYPNNQDDIEALSLSIFVYFLEKSGAVNLHSL